MNLSVEAAMKRQWKIHRKVQKLPDGQLRWDRAYQLMLEIVRTVEAIPTQTRVEVQDARSDLCQGVDPATSPNPNH